MDWSPEKVGTFINLKAFGACADFRRPGARLPEWRTIQQRYPHLIDRSPSPKRWFVSHRWDGPPVSRGQRDHPDRSGWQMEALLQLADHYAYDDPAICFWYDYMSLPQQPRTAAENAIFRSGLAGVRDLLELCPTVLLVSAAGADRRSDLDAHLQRGWILFELYIARTHVNIHLALYQREDHRVNRARRETDWDAVVPSIHAIAPWEDAAQLTKWFQRRNIVCTNGSDLRFLTHQLADSLGRYPDGAPMPTVTPGTVQTLTVEDLLRLAFIESCGLSTRRPDLYLAWMNYDASRGACDVLIEHRPPALAIGRWSDLKPGEAALRKIDPGTGRSPLYPGVLFRLSKSGLRVMPTID